MMKMIYFYHCSVKTVFSVPTHSGQLNSQRMYWLGRASFFSHINTYALIDGLSNIATRFFSFNPISRGHTSHIPQKILVFQLQFKTWCTSTCHFALNNKGCIPFFNQVVLALNGSYNFYPALLPVPWCLATVAAASVHLHWH